LFAVAGGDDLKTLLLQSFPKDSLDVQIIFDEKQTGHG
jgi:hypothetical protein